MKGENVERTERRVLFASFCCHIILCTVIVSVLWGTCFCLIISFISSFTQYYFQSSLTPVCLKSKAAVSTLHSFHRYCSVLIRSVSVSCQHSSA